MEVVPGARTARFPVGYNVWRKRIEARVDAPPVEGRANEALVELVAVFFDVPTRRVHVVAGAAARLKRIRVDGIDATAAHDRLAAALA